MAVVALILLGAIANAMSPPVEPPIAEASATERPTPTARPSRSPTTPAPVAPADPEFAYQLWLSTFDDQWDSMSGEMADALEQDFYWIQSVDQATYDPSTNRIVFDATIDFEVVYVNDPQEWRDDTWSLYQAWSRPVWASFVDGFESGIDVGADWARWTPGMVLNGNAGRLRAECPGSLIYRVSERLASQSDFLAECSFIP